MAEKNIPWRIETCIQTLARRANCVFPSGRNQFATPLLARPLPLGTRPVIARIEAATFDLELQPEIDGIAIQIQSLIQHIAFTMEATVPLFGATTSIDWDDILYLESQGQIIFPTLPFSLLALHIPPLLEYPFSETRLNQKAVEVTQQIVETSLHQLWIEATLLKITSVQSFTTALQERLATFFTAIQNEVEKLQKPISDEDVLRILITLYYRAHEMAEHSTALPISLPSSQHRD